jgi:hypothetical protein
LQTVSPYYTAILPKERGRGQTLVAFYTGAVKNGKKTPYYDQYTLARCGMIKKRSTKL